MGANAMDTDMGRGWQGRVGQGVQRKGGEGWWQGEGMGMGGVEAELVLKARTGSFHSDLSG